MFRNQSHTPEVISEAGKAAFMPHIIWQTVIFIVLMIALQVLAVLAASIIQFDNGKAPETCILLYSTIIISAGFIFYARFVERRPLRSLGFTSRRAAGSYVEGYFTGFAMFASAVGICCLLGALDFDGFAKSISWGALALWFFGFIFQGLEEEIALRGFFLTGAAVKIPVPVAVLLNSVIFAVLHLFNYGMTALAAFNLTLFGIFASLYFLRTDNIWGIGALHSAWNFTQGNITGINVSGSAPAVSIATFSPNECTRINGGEFGLEGGLAVTIVLVASIAIEIFRSRRTFEKNKSCGDSSL